jgi:hypothetical protein
VTRDGIRARIPSTRARPKPDPAARAGICRPNDWDPNFARHEKDQSPRVLTLMSRVGRLAEETGESIHGCTRILRRHVMKTKSKNKLSLSRETVRVLAHDKYALVHGGLYPSDGAGLTCVTASPTCITSPLKVRCDGHARPRSRAVETCGVLRNRVRLRVTFGPRTAFRNCAQRTCRAQRRSSLAS